MFLIAICAVQCAVDSCAQNNCWLLISYTGKVYGKQNPGILRLRRINLKSLQIRLLGFLGFVKIPKNLGF
jgi:hypothetical protein